MSLQYVFPPSVHVLLRHALQTQLSQAKDCLTPEETAKLSLYFCFLWFAANWTLNAALAYTSVASATVLSSMSCMGPFC